MNLPVIAAFPLLGWGLLASGPREIQGRLHPGVAQGRLEFRLQMQDEDRVVVAEARDGAFRVSLPPGRYTARCFAPGLMTKGTTVGVDAGTDRLDLDFQAEPSRAPKEVLDWLASHAIPLRGVEPGKGFEDLAPFKALVSNATLVGLGETTHGTHEFYRLKQRILEYLVEACGFSVLAIEAPFAKTEALNAFIQSGEGDPVHGVLEMGMWPWATQEVLDLLFWMRRYNQDPAHAVKLRLYGFDIQDPQASLQRVQRWGQKAFPEESRKLQSTFDQILRLPASSGGVMTQALRREWMERTRELDSILARLSGRRKELETRYPKDLVALGFQDLRQLALFAALGCPPEGANPGRVRDEGMAETVQWVRSREPGAKMVLWAHAAHLDAGSMGAGTVPMGACLRKAFGKDYLSVALGFREGRFQAMNTDVAAKGLKIFDVTPQREDELGGALANLQLPVLAVDLRTLEPSGAVRKWFEAPHGMWEIGATFGLPASPSLHCRKVHLLKRFDVLLFVNHPTSPAVPMAIPVSSEPGQVLSNLGFEQADSEGMPQGWMGRGSPLFAAQAVEERPMEGTRCLKVANGSPHRSQAPYSVTQKADGKPCRSNRLRVTAWVRKEDGKGLQAGIWLKVAREKGGAFYRNTLGEREVRKDWTRVVIEVPPVEDATEMTLGCLAVGTGVAWFDGIQLEWTPAGRT